MTLGYDKKLYILAFDHRGSFQKKMFGIAGDPTPEETATIADAKQLIYEGMALAVDRGAEAGATGVLVDEQFGGDIPAEAKAKDLVLAMPVEKSGQNTFDFEYGADFGAHIKAFDTDFSKVLVRYNPDGDAEMNHTQLGKLRELADWLHANDRRFLFELLVPAEEHQLAAVGGVAERYDAELRPGLVLQTMQELQAEGVEPDIWKIEGFEHRDDCVQAVAQARTGGRDGVVCIVLGRGADEAKVLHWLKLAAGVPGYSGFAVGRTLWWDELVRYVAGEVDGTEAAARIARNYRVLIDAYTGVSAGR
jgi:myo-inositol catabolism protein IolC